jgi:putative ABC transport system substrate-binding protein
MRRREFLTVLGGAAATWPLVAQAQQPTPIIGLLSGVEIEGIFASNVADFRLGLKETGFVEGQNVSIEYHTANGHAERMQELAADLVRRKVSLIFAMGGSNAVIAAKAATSTIPIVVAFGGDAVDLGLVSSVQKPEANLTGVNYNSSQLAPKRLELLCRIAPQAKLIGYLDNTATSSEFVRRELAVAAGSIGREIAVFYAGNEAEVSGAFEAMVRQRVGGFVQSSDAYLAGHRDQIISLAAHHALPAIYASRGPTQAGLISYGVLTKELLHQAGVYAGRILKGARPSDLPIQLPTKFEMVINLRVAKMLGVTVPTDLLAAADEVIE